MQKSGKVLLFLVTCLLLNVLTFEEHNIHTVKNQWLITKRRDVEVRLFQN